MSSTLEGKLERDVLTLLKPHFDAVLRPTYGITVDYASPVADPARPLPLNAYAGTYVNDLYREIEVALADGGLVLCAGPNKTPFTMRHWDRDTFIYQPTGENAYGPSGVMLEIGQDGRASGVRIEYLDMRGQGTYTRFRQRWAVVAADISRRLIRW